MLFRRCLLFIFCLLHLWFWSCTPAKGLLLAFMDSCMYKDCAGGPKVLSPHRCAIYTLASPSAVVGSMRKKTCLSNRLLPYGVLRCCRTWTKNASLVLCPLIGVLIMGQKSQIVHDDLTCPFRIGTLQVRWVRLYREVQLQRCNWLYLNACPFPSTSLPSFCSAQGRKGNTQIEHYSQAFPKIIKGVGS